MYLDYFVRSHSRKSAIPPNSVIDNLPIAQFYKNAAEDQAHKDFLLKYYANGKIAIIKFVKLFLIFF
jgi:hypothetical protein